MGSKLNETIPKEHFKENQGQLFEEFTLVKDQKRVACG